MLDGYGADPARLRDRARLTGLLDTLPALLGMHPIAPAQVVEVGPNNLKDPGGLSGFVMIAESHISFHTFPARGFVSIDLYTCRDTIDRARVVGLLTEAFAITSLDVFVAGSRPALPDGGPAHPRTHRLRLRPRVEAGSVLRRCVRPRRTSSATAARSRSRGSP